MKRPLLAFLLATILLALAPGTEVRAQSEAQASPPPKKNIFAKMWELEKRKNAAILRFLRIKK